MIALYYVLVFLGAYLIGNISPATIMAKLAGLDIRKEGSGNPGTTNALRVLGNKAGAVTLLIDVLKGSLAVVLGGLSTSIFVSGGPSPEAMGLVAGLGVILGHLWPAFFKFKGGKGVATTFGVLLAVSFPLCLACLGVLVLLVILSKKVSPGSLGAAVSLPVLTPFLGGLSYREEGSLMLVWAFLIGIIIIGKHRENIKRLLKREEPNLSFKKKGSHT